MPADAFLIQSHCADGPPHGARRRIFFPFSIAMAFVMTKSAHRLNLLLQLAS
jgi:hypothetical protein